MPPCRLCGSRTFAAKAAVEMLTKCLALEWGPAGLRANCITPGATSDTGGMRHPAPTEDARRQIERAIPLRRFGTKDELADLALFLSSEAASYVTGAVYVCNSGASLPRRDFSVATPVA